MPVAALLTAQHDRCALTLSLLVSHPILLCRRRAHDRAGTAESLVSRFRPIPLRPPPTLQAMGLFSLTQQASTPLTPFHPPLGVNPHYCVPVVTTLVLKVSFTELSAPRLLLRAPLTSRWVVMLQEKAFSFSGDDFGIKDAQGNTVVLCHGSALSFRDKKGPSGSGGGGSSHHLGVGELVAHSFNPSCKPMDRPVEASQRKLKLTMYLVCVWCGCRDQGHVRAYAVPTRDQAALAPQVILRNGPKHREGDLPGQIKVLK